MLVKVQCPFSLIFLLLCSRLPSLRVLNYCAVLLVWPLYRIWQSRPLSDELIECASADVAYLIPLMEELVTVINGESQQLSGQLAAAFRGTGPRSSALAGWVPFETSMVDELARAVGQGHRNVERLLEWANASDAFHQLPFKDMWPDRLGGGRY
jgi:hypothetical protein